MSAAFDTDEATRDMFNRWQIAGHTVIVERGTFRHAQFKRDHDPEAVLKVDGVPYLNSQGKTVKVGQLLPERADLALDMDGNVLPKHEFEKRYRDFLRYVPMIEGSDPGAEHIPDPVRWVTQVIDTYSESVGPVEAGWDANVPALEEATHTYDPKNDKLIEIVETNAKSQAEINAAVLEGLKGLSEKQAPPPKRGPGRPRKETTE